MSVHNAHAALKVWGNAAMLMSRTTEPTTALPAPWARPATAEPCNFHYVERAVVRYAGTPLCERCALELARTREPFWR